MTDNSTPAPPLSPPPVRGHHTSPDGRFLEKTLIMVGLLFCAAGAGALFYGAYLVFTTGSARRMFADLRDVSFIGLVAINIDLIAIFIFGFLLSIIGLQFFKRASQSTNYVIRPEDRDNMWPLIKDAKIEAVDQYIRLASLSGFSGAFTKVGFTGLPLATVGLTIFFVVLSLAFTNPDLMELGKLTLGAFIGSFVQRQVERGQRPDASGAHPAPMMRSDLPV
jgi:hypothetical protein